MFYLVINQYFRLLSRSLAQKLSRLWQIVFQNWTGHGKPKYWATPFWLGKNVYLLGMYKKCFYDFFPSLLVSDFEKFLKALPSRVQCSLVYCTRVFLVSLSDRAYDMIRLRTNISTQIERRCYRTRLNATPVSNRAPHLEKLIICQLKMILSK